MQKTKEDTDFEPSVECALVTPPSSSVRCLLGLPTPSSVPASFVRLRPHSEARIQLARHHSWKIKFYFQHIFLLLAADLPGSTPVSPSLWF